MKSYNINDNKSKDEKINRDLLKSISGNIVVYCREIQHYKNKAAIIKAIFMTSNLNVILNEFRRFTPQTQLKLVRTKNSNEIEVYNYQTQEYLMSVSMNNVFLAIDETNCDELEVIRELIESDNDLPNALKNLKIDKLINR